MRKGKKIALILAAVFLLSGMALGAFALSRMDYSLEQLRLHETREQKYTVTEPFDSVSVQCSSGVYFDRAETDTCTVTCRESQILSYAVSVENGVLTIRENDTSRWYDIFNIWAEGTGMQVLLPNDVYTALTVSSLNGSVHIPNSFAFDQVSVQSDTGSAYVNAQVKDTLSVLSDTGDIVVQHIRPRTMQLQTDTGSVRVEDVQVREDMHIITETGTQTLDETSCRSLTLRSSTGDIHMTLAVTEEALSIESGTGDITMRYCDAQTMELRTDTGDITGVLLTEKIFYARSATGDVAVPQTMHGGRCVIESDTGDITMTIEESAQQVVSES